MARSLNLIFADRVTLLRKERGLTQESLALLAGLDRTYVSGIERSHRNVTIKTVELIAQALDVKAYELFKEDGR